MTFYKNGLIRAVVYETPSGDFYRVGVYQEEYPDGRSETVTGTADSMSESEKNRFMGEAEEVDREEVPPGVIITLRNKLSDEDAP